MPPLAPRALPVATGLWRQPLPWRQRPLPARAVQLPAPDLALADQAHRCAQRLAARSCRALVPAQDGWRRRAGLALNAYRAAEMALSRPQPCPEGRAAMAVLQRLAAAIGEVRVICDQYPDPVGAWTHGLNDLMPQLVGRQRLLVAHLPEADAAWHLGPHLADGRRRLRRDRLAAVSWQMPALIARPLANAEAWVLREGCLHRAQSLLGAMWGLDGGMGMWRLRSWLLSRARADLACAQRLLEHDGRHDRGRPAYLWRRRVGPLGDPLAQRVADQLAALAERQRLVRLEISLLGAPAP